MTSSVVVRCGIVVEIWRGSLGIFGEVPWAYLTWFLEHIWSGSLGIFGVVPWAYLAMNRWVLGRCIIGQFGDV